ncbi:CD1247 N-terminal domain-containing protein [Garciella nitratireducens]|uniref:MJ0042 family finger-like domain-containing protein n=1 Tax=Garciella nitratireducens DSM 15102 TaxID=1121911 RepID=A0A1T4K4I7_9FIRM|nr:CD1247 N-terminal domain-containing protein [Garciella nitratireducens]RBP46668.1 hypothetical protein DFR81_10160 [Garciella nitratireducens]SJZ37326.1 hypothetical protein SAMN02745973_00337 [Garciella nitratireducens DSM 15102]
MNYINEKVSYLKGLTEGLGISDSTKEGKVLLHIVDVLDDISEALEGLVEAQNDLEDYVEVIDEDLSDLEEEIYDDMEDLEDIDFCEIECPECGEIVYVDIDMLDENNHITCPNCEQEIEVDFSCDCDNEDCNC